MKLTDHYKNAKESLIKSCVKCGNCIRQCRIIGYTGIDAGYRDIQDSIISYLKGGEGLLPGAEKKVSSCMRCFGCLDIDCAAGVTSTLINELVDFETENRKEKPWDMELYPPHEKLARAGTTAKEYERIMSEKIEKGADVLFFPGCNVYKQPDKLLNALVIMDEIGIPYSFAPGMKYCCGWTIRGRSGDAEWLAGAASMLMGHIEELGVKKAVFWCPTCMCVINDRIKKFYDPQFECVTFGQFILENIEKLSFPFAEPQKVTYHEPCKTCYMGIDAAEDNSVRKILQKIPGTKLVEMEHHKSNDTMCCGCSAIDKAFETGDKITVARLKEAAATGADALVDVCHNCHWIFVPARNNHPGEGLDINIVNYSDYITRAMGKPRKDTLR